MSIYAGADAAAPSILKGDFVAGRATSPTTSRRRRAGDYYFQCDIHPNMNGKAHVA